MGYTITLLNPKENTVKYSEFIQTNMTFNFYDLSKLIDFGVENINGHSGKNVQKMVLKAMDKIKNLGMKDNKQQRYKGDRNSDIPTRSSSWYFGQDEKGEKLSQEERLFVYYTIWEDILQLAIENPEHYFVSDYPSDIIPYHDGNYIYHGLKLDYGYYGNIIKIKFFDDKEEKIEHLFN